MAPHTGSVCTTDSVSALLEDLQFTLGEGPCMDRVQRGPGSDRTGAVGALHPSLAGLRHRRLAAGVRAVFGFPIRVGAVQLGALNLYRSTPGPLTAEQHADTLVLADLAAEIILLLQAEAPPGELAAELESSASLHYVVHQASGMVAAQLGVGVEHALVRLRAFRVSVMSSRSPRWLGRSSRGHCASIRPTRSAVLCERTATSSGPGRFRDLAERRMSRSQRPQAQIDVRSPSSNSHTKELT